MREDKENKILYLGVFDLRTYAGSIYEPHPTDLKAEPFKALLRAHQARYTYDGSTIVIKDRDPQAYNRYKAYTTEEDLVPHN